MTEDCWLASKDPQFMLCFLTANRLFPCTHCGGLWEYLSDGTWTFLPGQELRPCCDNAEIEETAELLLPGRRISDRKLRLFACAAERDWWRGMDPRQWPRQIHASIRVAEAWADKLLAHDSKEVRRFQDADAPWLRPKARDAALGLLAHSSSADAGRQAELVREIVGNPFRPLPATQYYQLDDSWGAKDRRRLPWITPTALSIARFAYDRRDFLGLQILADALEDAGCRSEEILGHLRGPGPHVRGCWALDLILGKE